MEPPTLPCSACPRVELSKERRSTHVRELDPVYAPARKLDAGLGSWFLSFPCSCDEPLPHLFLLLLALRCLRVGSDLQHPVDLALSGCNWRSSDSIPFGSALVSPGKGETCLFITRAIVGLMCDQIAKSRSMSGSFVSLVITPSGQGMWRNSMGCGYPIRLSGSYGKKPRSSYSSQLQLSNQLNSAV